MNKAPIKSILFDPWFLLTWWPYEAYYIAKEPNFQLLYFDFSKRDSNFALKFIRAFGQSLGLFLGFFF